MHKILCIGATGFVISNFIRYILRNYSDYKIIGIDKINSPRDLNYIYRNKGCNFHICDITNLHSLDMIFALEQPDIVVHGAIDYNNILNSNIIGTQNIIDLSNKYNIKKLIYLNNIYNKPKNQLEVSKTAAEMLIEVSGINYNIVKSVDNYGPRQSINNIVPKLINSIINNIQIVENNNTIDLLHVQDYCSAIYDIINKGVDQETYIVSANQEFTIIEVFQEICNYLGTGYDLLKYSNESNIYTKVDNSKLKELGWEYNFKFRDGIAHTTKWYIDNSWFLRNV